MSNNELLEGFNAWHVEYCSRHPELASLHGFGDDKKAAAAWKAATAAKNAEIAHERWLREQAENRCVAVEDQREALREQLDWTVKENDRLLNEGRELTARAERLAEKDALERDAARYRQWRDKMISQDHTFIGAMQDSLPDAVGKTRPPTADEWDSAIDATMQPAGHCQEVPRG